MTIADLIDKLVQTTTQLRPDAEVRIIINPANAEVEILEVECHHRGVYISTEDYEPEPAHGS